MKITIDVDCTPDEARRFLGLPDVAPMQEALMAQLQERLEQNVKAMDAESLMKVWLPAGLQGLEQLQKMFWAQMGVGAPPDAGTGGAKRGPGDRGPKS